MYIFISYSSVNYDVAEEVCNLIEKSGKQCFLAPRDIRTGYPYAEEILNGIERSDVMLLLLSKAANSSPHVLREVERAVSKRIPLIVYKLEEVQLSKSMEYFLMSHQWVNAKPGVGHEEIVRCVDVYAGKKEGNETLTLQQNVNATQKKSWGKWLGLAAVLVVFLIAGIVWGSRFIVQEETTGDATRVTEQASKEGQTTDDTDSIEEIQATQEPEIEIVAGSTIVFGSYLGESIEWRVLKLSEEGKSAVIVSKDILTMKAYDAAESGSYNYYNGKDYWGEDISGEEETVLHQIRGNNDWSLSNIRTWLNSTAENVTYEGQKPIQISMSEYKNGYDTEPGFLSNFSEEERGAIIETEVETNGKVTRDKVFLLSAQELAWFEEADVSLVVKPTEVAKEQDTSDWYEVNVSSYGVEDYCWWLRDCDSEGLASEAYLVGSSYSGCKIYTETVGLEGYGIRPALTIDLTSKCFEIK